MQDRIRGDAYRTVKICVDSYEQGVPVGRLYYAGQDEGCDPFFSLSQLLVKMEHILDSVNYPQSYEVRRTFGTVSEPLLSSTVDKRIRKGEMATFLVKVLFRQHASWQGAVTWQEKQAEQPFRSVLEWVLLMDSALCGR